MNGNIEYDNKIEKRIENKIINNSDIKILRGYVNSIIGRRTYATVYDYLNKVVKFIRETGKDPSELRYEDYINYLATLIRKTSSYQITVYAALKKLSSYLCEIELCNKDYMEKIEMPKLTESISTKMKRENNYLTTEELHIYIDNIKNCVGKNSREMSIRESWNERDVAIVMILLTTGMRCSALYKLDVDSIDFNNKTIITIDKEMKIEEHFLTDEVIDSINRWLKRREILLKRYPETKALFISKNRERLSQCGISEITKKYSINVNGKIISPHKLRATYGTHLYENTHDLYVVQQCMNHASPKTTEKYIRGQKNSGRENAAKIITNILY